MPEDKRGDSGAKSERGRQTDGPRAPGTADAKKDRLAAALRENLKRRKAQISARRQDTPSE